MMVYNGFTVLQFDLVFSRKYFGKADLHDTGYQFLSCNDAFWFQFDLFRIHPNSEAFLKTTDLTEVTTFWRNDTVLAIVTRGKNGSDFNDLPGKKYSTWRTSCHSITRLASYVFIANEAIIFKNFAFLHHCCAAAFQWLTVTMTVTFDKCTDLCVPFL